MDCLLHDAEAFLLRAVIVGRGFESSLRARFDERLVERVPLPARPDMQRTAGAAPALLAAMRGFHALEVGKHVGESPAGRTLPGPVIEVAGVTAHIDHAVD